jgi:hypothetical protein
LWFIYNDVYPEPRALPRTPAVDSLLAVEMRSMWDGMARGLAEVVACQRRIDADPRLGALLRESPIYLAMAPGGPLQWAPQLDPDRPPPRDSLIALFGGLAYDSTALLYTIRIGSFADSASARRSSARFPWLKNLREGGDEWDSTMVFNWNHYDCSIGDHDKPTLFVLPANVSETGRWTVLSGLFVGRRDANRWLARIRRRGGAGAEIALIRVTGFVMSLAIPPD